ncbi:MAG: mycothione reductase [Acidimicrobiia bacterium]|nr:mycothione reductase [Acidimicrobiia bacterium]
MQEFDLIVVGTGSGNAIPAELADWRVALVERDVFGGTCLNRGCIPSKMLVHVADMAAQARDAGRFGVEAHVASVDWPAIVRRVFGRIDPIAAGGEDYRANRCPNVSVFRGTARLVEPKVVEVAGERLTAPQVLLAAGARPTPLEVPGLDRVPWHTSDTIMRMEGLPERLVVFGGGYIAAELGHVFGSLGVDVTFVLRGPVMLSGEDGDVSALVTEAYGRRHRLVTSARDLRVEELEGRTVVAGVGSDGPFTAPADVVLVAVGRTSNGDELGAAAVGIATDGGRVLTDSCLQASVPGVWALGDLTNTEQLKHLANAEARVAFHNIAAAGRAGDVASLSPASLRRIDRTLVPHAIFGHPQVASVGLRERDVLAAGVPYVSTIKSFGDTAWGWALEDTTSACKLIAHAESRLLLGAHIVGPQASTLIQPLIQGMRFGQTVDALAREVWYIHPAPTEVVENALLAL